MKPNSASKTSCPHQVDARAMLSQMIVEINEKPWKPSETAYLPESMLSPVMVWNLWQPMKAKQQALHNAN